MLRLALHLFDFRVHLGLDVVQRLQAFGLVGDVRKQLKQIAEILVIFIAHRNIGDTGLLQGGLDLAIFRQRVDQNHQVGFIADDLLHARRAHGADGREILRLLGDVVLPFNARHSGAARHVPQLHHGIEHDHHALGALLDGDFPCQHVVIGNGVCSLRDNAHRQVLLFRSGFLRAVRWFRRRGRAGRCFGDGLRLRAAAHSGKKKRCGEQKRYSGFSNRSVFHWLNCSFFNVVVWVASGAAGRVTRNSV